MFPNYINLEGLDLRDWSKHFFNISGIFDTSHEIITNKIYSIGESYNRSKIQMRKVILNGVVKDISYLNILKGVLYKKGLKKLTIGIPGMPIFYLMVDIESFGSDSNYPRKISIQLTAPDPRLYSDTPQVISLGNISSSGLTYPLTYPITYGIPTGAITTVINEGNTIGYPIFTIVGTCSNLILSNVTTSETMILSISLADNDILIVDCLNKEIKLNGIKRMDLKNGDWISCIPGENEIGFTRSSLQEKQHCYVEFRSVWL